MDAMKPKVSPVRGRLLIFPHDCAHKALVWVQSASVCLMARETILEGNACRAAKAPASGRDERKTPVLFVNALPMLC